MSGQHKKIMPIVNVQRLIRRNERCPGCASGKKFKFCCMTRIVKGETLRACRPAERKSL